MKKVYHILLFAILSVSIAAQSPQAIQYQAVVRDSDGNLLKNHKVAYELSILDGSATGPVVYTETHVDTTNEHGMSNLMIGLGTPVLGTFNTINWGTSHYFIKMSIDINGGTSYMVMGTSPILSVPYALYATKAKDAVNSVNAENAETAASVDWDDVESKPTTLSGMGITSPYQITAGSVGCHTLASVTSTYQKLADIGTFDKLNSRTLVEITYNGRLAIDNIVTGNGASFELRVDNHATSIGRSRTVVRNDEEGIKGIPVSLFAAFNSLSTGTHTISIWVRVPFGSGTNARINPNCWDTDAFFVKESK